jgi:hypothetical protein
LPESACRHPFDSTLAGQTLSHSASDWTQNQIGSKISGNQIVRTSAAANIDLGGCGTDQITVAIERIQKARLIGTGIRLNSPQRIFLDKE